MGKKAQKPLYIKLEELEELLAISAIIVDREYPCRLWTEEEYWAIICMTADKRLIDTETKSTILTNHQVQPPSDPAIASVLHPRHNPRPGRILLENVNNRPPTMDRGTQANEAANVVLDNNDAPSTSNEPTNNELYRNANISVTNQKLLTNGGDSSSVDSLNSADSAKRESEESIIELAEFNQPMISKDNIDGQQTMGNGDGKFPGTNNGKPINGVVKDYPVDDDTDKTSCGMECLYFAMQCCECTIM
ncbi:uncharacterized protein LOC126896192 isoform X2 [Daktulosphaira vitifoliae]|uniref:uncharacterized protein LOC126896192 isoform X2 n=1 Tax=Daktulosphaira vitifoliae TaxID=58002 RepID=UPI0021AA68E2|nr:uncharacterized protein LOC126896192 isoform X2 [Daktulosphaira vitifoliae]